MAHAGCFSVSIIYQTLKWTTGSLTRTGVNVCDCSQGCMDTTRESAPKVDSGRKIPRHTRESNLHDWHACPTLHQLSYNPAHAGLHNKTILKTVSHMNNFYVANKKGRSGRVNPSSDWVTGKGHEGWLNGNPFPVFSAKGRCQHLQHELGRPLFNNIHPALIFSANHDVAHPPRCPERWLWKAPPPKKKKKHICTIMYCNYWISKRKRKMNTKHTSWLR